MSLLNDMLRDLSQHQPAVDGVEDYDVEFLQSSIVLHKKKSVMILAFVIFAVIFVSVIAVKIVWHRMSMNAGNTTILMTENKSIASQGASSAMVNSPRHDILVAAPIPINSKLNDSRVTKSASVIETSLENQKSVNSSITPEVENHIQDLLQQASRAMGMDRLTSPIEDNAYSYYQKILSLDSSRAQAIEGLHIIAARYLTRAKEQVQLGNQSQADAYLQRAKYVAPEYAKTHENEVRSTKVTESGAIVTANDNVIAQADINLTPDTEKKLSTSESVHSFAVAEAAMVEVSASPGWKDEQLSHHAQELIQLGKNQEAVELLKKFIVAEKSPALSAAVLAEFYIQQGNADAAQIVLNEITYFSEDTKAKISAQLLSMQGKDAEAVSVLEQHLSSATNNEDYRALLASLYHRTANYQQSAVNYQRLMASFGEKPAYWLGLALAYDGLSQQKSALQAYLRLREFPQLQAQVITYIDQRIAALRSQ